MHSGIAHAKMQLANKIVADAGSGSWMDLVRAHLRVRVTGHPDTQMTRVSRTVQRQLPRFCLRTLALPSHPLAVRARSTARQDAAQPQPQAPSQMDTPLLSLWFISTLLCIAAAAQVRDVDSRACARCQCQDLLRCMQLPTMWLAPF